MSGADWTVPGKGANVAALRRAIGQVPYLGDGVIRTDLKLTGLSLDYQDYGRVREVLAHPELHQTTPGAVAQADGDPGA